MDAQITELKQQSIEQRGMEVMDKRLTLSEVRENIVGMHQMVNTPFGKRRLVYADWTASGRLYAPIEEKLAQQIGPYVANTHTETSFTGSAMTHAYHKAREIIKKHVNAGKDDVLITCGSGMTAAVTKFQRILGLKICDRLRPYTAVPEDEKPVIFVTHMEHHSNQTTWLETIAHVEVIDADDNGLVDFKDFERLLKKYQHKKLKIAAVTGGSNVTGIIPDYYRIADRIHEAGGLCFVDFACAGPYVNMDMHPADRPDTWLDAVYFSPHKFLGGPGTPGVLVFNRKLYKNVVPDMPGGGTVTYTNPWGEHCFIDDIEAREDGGTPAFMQTIKAALAIQLKEQIGVDTIWKREHELLQLIFNDLEAIPNLHILAGQHKNRLGVISFFVENMHFNLGVKLLSDRFGVQVRGGCSCAGTYGHFLLHVNRESSLSIKSKIDTGDNTEKPGWIRMSIHPTTTDEEALFICDAIRQVAENHREWSADYQYDKYKNEFFHKTFQPEELALVEQWFD